MSDGVADPTACVVAIAAVRTWARWLRGFADASVPYLLDEMVRRPGALRVDEERVVVAMDRRPHDVVLEMSGCFEPLANASWLGGRALQLVLRGG